MGWLGRIGLAAQGICFTTIAVLALQLALGDGGEATDPQGAFRVLASHGWTRALLVLLVCGFVGSARAQSSAQTVTVTLVRWPYT